MLQQHGLAVAGSGAVDAVTLAHSGLSLYPIDSDQLGGSGLQVGGALVLLEEGEEEGGSAGGSSSSGSSSGGGGGSGA